MHRKQEENTKWGRKGSQGWNPYISNFGFYPNKTKSWVEVGISPDLGFEKKFLLIEETKLKDRKGKQDAKD